MSGWLHPEGPESVVTYWSRRLVVIAAAVLVLVLGIVLVSTAAQGSEPARTAGPAPVPAATTEPSVAPTADSEASPSAGASASSTASPSASASPSTSVSPSTSASPSTKASSSASASPSTSASTSASATPSAPATPACDPARLRTTLQGDPSPKVGKRVVFSLSVINGNAQACVLKRNAARAELKIYSGTDRIWSTDDCVTLVRSTVQVLKPEQAIAWKLTWDGRRSAPGCKTRPEAPRPGTYFATFQLAGAKPVQQRMLLSS